MDFVLKILLFGDPKLFGKASRLDELHCSISYVQSSFEKRRGHGELLCLCKVVRGDQSASKHKVREMEVLRISVLVI